jgi:hypothetical protein
MVSRVSSGADGGGDAVPLTLVSGRPGIVPKWSPDGEWIAFADGPDLVLVDRDGDRRRVLGSIESWEPWTVRWSPGGEWVAAMGEGSSPGGETVHAAFVVSPAGGGLRVVTGWDERGYKEGLEWHPSGAFLNYVYYPSLAASEVRKAYPDGRASEVMIDQPDHWDYVGIWHPGGERYYFVATLHEDGLISHVFDLGTGSISHPGFPTPEHWDRGGGTFVTSERRLGGQLWMAPLPE